LYAQDSFRWSRELTLSFGVRWDYFGVIPEKHNRFGNMGCNSLIGPPYKPWDVSFYKHAVLAEQVKLQFRAELYNIVNHPNFASPPYPGFPRDVRFRARLVGSGLQRNRLHRSWDRILPADRDWYVGVGNPFLGGGGPRGIQLALKLSF